MERSEIDYVRSMKDTLSRHEDGRSRRFTRLAALALAGFLLAATALWSQSRPTHAVSQGDTLSEIAEQYGITVADLKKWNRLKSDRILAGQRLFVASEEEIRDDSAAETSTAGDSQNGEAAAGTIPAADTPVKTPRGPATYAVRRGDTLSDIAREQNVPIDTLKDINELGGDRIYAGQVLRLRDPEPSIAGSIKAAAADETSQEGYIVQRGDTLSQIAERFDVSVSLLRRLNGLRGSRIYAGQKLKLRPTTGRDRGIHVVQQGETLSEIGEHYGIPVRALCEINGIEGSRIFVGQTLRLRAVSGAVHIVEPGDALSEIAYAYGMSVGELMKLNGLKSSRIYPGQELKLAHSGTDRLETYTVRRGDSLIEIAQLHRMTLAELRNLNGIRGSVIHPGQTLKVRPILGRVEPPPPLLTLEEIDWSGFNVPVAGVSQLEIGNGPYYGYSPRAQRQSGRNYLEESPARPLTNYRRARRLFEAFERKVESMGRLSQKLEGWHIVLDPGHGGIDPGTITRTVDGRGDAVYIVEDEYVYDITLRIYVLLKLHGAEVTLTLLSPNHLIRHSDPPTRTFVHQRDEVYNSEALNRRNGDKQWPIGGQRGLDARIRIVRDAFRNIPSHRRIFLSIHADNSPNTPNVPLVLYYSSSKYTDRRSRSFARALLPALGAGAQIRGQRLGVLRNNPASYKVLVEVRNMVYPDHSWALRFEELRQRDAEKVVRGVLDWISRQ
jgi:LysM repeat protein